jgi:benzoyl-CoA 2,3-dioxygenase component B
MTPVYEPGEFAGWIAPPSSGINGLGVDYPYVKIS